MQSSGVSTHGVAFVGVTNSHHAGALVDHLRVAAAAGLALLSHGLYASFDLIGRRLTGHRLSTLRTLGTAAISYAFNLNAGSLVGGFALRLRLYTRAGLSAGTVGQIVTHSFIANWLGWCWVLGTVLVLSPPRLQGDLERTEPWPADFVERFGALPLQHEGRVMPFSTLAATTLYAVHGRRDVQFDAGELEHYLRHRYAVAGGQRFPFTKLAVKRIHQHSGGVPRLANIIAERALLAGYAHDEVQIGERWVDAAAREALAPRLSKLPRLNAAHGVGAVIALAALGVWLWPERPAPEPLPATTTAALPAPAPATVETVVPYLPGESLAQRIALAGASAEPAWRQLLGLWTVRAQEAAVADASRCPPVVAPGLYCLRGRASLDKLSALGRPALLRLSGPEGEAWALLLGADALHVRLWLGGGRFDTDRLAFERSWNGEYAALWRGPAFLLPAPAPGDSGPAVDWIHDRLRDRAGLQSAEAGPAVLDAHSLDAVRRLQDANGLVPDGVIGPETLMALAARENEGPRLRRVLD